MPEILLEVGVCDAAGTESAAADIGFNIHV